MSRPSLKITLQDVNVIEAMEKYAKNPNQQNLENLRNILNIQNLPENFGVDFAAKINESYKETIEQMLARVCDSDEVGRNVAELMENCGVKVDVFEVRLGILHKNSQEFLKKRREEEERQVQYRKEQIFGLPDLSLEGDLRPLTTKPNIRDIKKQIEQRMLDEMNLKQEWKEFSELHKLYEKGKISQQGEYLPRLLTLTEKFEKLKEFNPKLFEKVSKDESREIGRRKSFAQKMRNGAQSVKNLFGGKNKKVAISNSLPEGADLPTDKSTFLARRPDNTFFPEEERGASAVVDSSDSHLDGGSGYGISVTSTGKLDKKGKGRARGGDEEYSSDFSEVDI